MADIDLYPQSRSPSLDPALFRDPTAAYRGAPFWSWNTRLSLPRLMRQIDVFEQMGMGGFHVHSRTGLATEYLGPEFMEAVKASVERAREKGMRCYLYDEDRWPSGFAGGLVTKEERFRSRHLLWTRRPYGPERQERQGVNVSVAGGIRQENGELLGTYAVRLEDGWLADYRRLEPDETADHGCQTWYAYLEHSGDVPWFNNQAYVDTLNPEAIAAFIACTHERYAALLRGDFGELVPSIFTDEPQFPHKSFFDRSDDGRDLTIPWTAGFGTDIADALPEVFWELPEGQPSSISTTCPPAWTRNQPPGQRNRYCPSVAAPSATPWSRGAKSGPSLRTAARPPRCSISFGKRRMEVESSFSAIPTASTASRP